jgi:hypothetical protein
MIALAVLLVVMRALYCRWMAFANVWVAPWRGKVLELVEHLDACAAECGVDYFTAYGTLLGQVRHGGLIPWDDDVDVAVMEHDFERLAPLLALGPTWRLHKMNDFMYKLMYAREPAIKGYAWSWPFVDIFLMRRLGDDVYCPIDGPTHPHTDIFPTRRLPFEDLFLSAPANPSAVLTREFGPSWASVCDSGGWCHRFETSRWPRWRASVDQAVHESQQRDRWGPGEK